MCLRPTTKPSAQQVAQDASPGEGQFQQLVNAPHQLKVSLADGLGCVVHQAAANVDDLGLARDRQRVAAVDHRFALNMPGSMSASS